MLLQNPQTCCFSAHCWNERLTEVCAQNEPPASNLHSLPSPSAYQGKKPCKSCSAFCVRAYPRKSSCRALMRQQDGTGGERPNRAAASENHPREGSNWIKFSTIRFRRLLTGEKAQYFSLSTNLLQSYTTPMQQQPQLYAVNNKQIYFHQPC